VTKRELLGNTIVLLGFGAIAVATLRPGPEAMVTSRWTCLVCGPFGGADVLANVLLFLPYGIGLGLVGGRWGRALVLVVATTCMIELFQYRVLVGREGTISDVITNSIGGALGIAMGAHWRALILPRARASGMLGISAAIIWILVLGAAGRAMTPSYRPAGAEVVIAPSFPPSPRFAGRVSGARIGGVAVTSGARLPNDVPPDPTLEATIVAAGPVDGQAPIVWVGHDRLDEELLLAQRGDRLVFRARLRAADWRLKVPAVAIDHAVGDGPGLDRAGTAPPEADVRAAVAGNIITLGIDRHAGPAVSTAITLSPMLGWALLAPSAVISSPTVRWITAVWVAVLLCPTGYWSTRAVTASTEARVPASDRVAAGLGRAGVAVALGGGFVVVPLAALHSLAHWSEWLAGCAGVASGASIALAAQSAERRIRSHTP
jgi:hypothetical protein